MIRLLLVPAIVLATVVFVVEYHRDQVGDRQLTKSQLEDFLRHRYGLRDVTLTEGSSWTYTGSGMDERGTRFYFGVLQDGESRTIHHFWEDAERSNAGGDESTVHFSNPRSLYLALVGGYCAWLAVLAVWRSRLRRNEGIDPANIQLDPIAARA